MSERADAAVIGGGVSGLAAAALLAKAGLRTLLFEQVTTVTAGASDPSLRALDPRLVKELKLAKRGLKFTVRDAPLTILRGGAPPLNIVRDRHATARSLAQLSPADAAAFAVFQQERLTLARAMRLGWWDGAAGDEARVALKPAQRDVFDRLAVTSAASWLAERFESDALKAALAFDAVAAGFAPSEPGSALALLWAASQEMCGLQGAVALPKGGEAGVAQALVQAAEAAGATLRANATVSRLLADRFGVHGLELAAGEQIEVPIVLSTLTRARTLESLIPTALTGLGGTRAVPRIAAGSATLVFGLNRQPEFGGRRVVIAERLETYETAFAAARLGRMPVEPVVELVQPPPEGAAAALESRVQLFARAWPVPVGDGFDSRGLADTVTAIIARHIPGFAAASCDVLKPQADAPSVTRLLASAPERSATPVGGLFLCGEEAEPADAVSGRAARHAVLAALALHRGNRR